MFWPAEHLPTKLTFWPVVGGTLEDEVDILGLQSSFYPWSFSRNDSIIFVLKRSLFCQLNTLAGLENFHDRWRLGFHGQYQFFDEVSGKILYGLQSQNGDVFPRFYDHIFSGVQSQNDDGLLRICSNIFSRFQPSKWRCFSEVYDHIFSGVQSQYGDVFA